MEWKQVAGTLAFGTTANRFQTPEQPVAWSIDLQVLPLNRVGFMSCIRIFPKRSTSAPSDPTFRPTAPSS